MENEVRRYTEQALLILANVVTVKVEMIWARRQEQTPQVVAYMEMLERVLPQVQEIAVRRDTAMAREFMVAVGND
jgi:hypothetical protein